MDSLWDVCGCILYYMPGNQTLSDRKNDNVPKAVGFDTLNFAVCPEKINQNVFVISPTELRRF